jgi:hypothetical protein
MEASRRKVNTDEICALAEIYGVSAAWLLEEEELENPLVELAARELSRLDDEDLDLVLDLLKTLRARR